MAEYPAELTRTCRLFDGTLLTIRPIRPEDAAMEQAFVRHLSPDSRYYRFMESLRELPPRKLEELTAIDYQRHMGLVGTVSEAGREVEVGVARYVVGTDPRRCEFAIAVDDAWQGRGVAGLLMAPLMEIAKARGIEVMEGLVLASNHKMLKFARQLGFRVQHDPGEWQTVRVVRDLQT